MTPRFFFVFLAFSFWRRERKTAAQIKIERVEPAVEAMPIGKSVSGNPIEAKYANGIRTQSMDRKLCRKENSDRPSALKYPLKQK